MWKRGALERRPRTNERTNEKKHHRCPFSKDRDKGEDAADDNVQNDRIISAVAAAATSLGACPPPRHWRPRSSSVSAHYAAPSRARSSLSATYRSRGAPLPPQAGPPDAAATAVADNDRPGTFALLCAPWVWRLGGGGSRDRRGRELAFTAVGGEDGGDGDDIVRCAGTCHPCSRSGGGIAPGGNLGDPAPALLGLAERGGCWATGVLPGLP